MQRMRLTKLLSSLVVLALCVVVNVESVKASWWSFQAIDTMKYSRDPSREYLNDPERLQQVTEEQVAAIAQTGATHVAIATPYDEEFLPVLTVWVKTARAHNLSIWFRGNWSGWEGWFDYPTITQKEHIEKTVVFIKSNAKLFENGDVFTACPECENGKVGDPRQTGAITEHRKFLIDEYQAVNEAFRSIGKNVQTNYNSMNGDVAKVIMDQATTKALGGLVVIDHYVKTPEQLNLDVTEIAQLSGGQVILGEMGAPIPDIHGSMSYDQQAKWLGDSLALLARNPKLKGLSYWTNLGGSTALWKDSGEAKPAVAVLTTYFTPAEAKGKIINTLGRSVKEALIKSERWQVITQVDGNFILPYIDEKEPLLVSAQEYQSQTVAIQDLADNSTIALTPENPSFWYRIQFWLHELF